MRAVVDTNVIISAFLKANSVPGDVLLAWRRGEFELVTSGPLLAELWAVLIRGSIRKRTTYSRAQEIAAIVEFGEGALVVAPDLRLTVVASDPDDDRVLEAAVAGNADYIVSGDRDLLSLESYDGIAIVSAAKFIAILSEVASPD